MTPIASANADPPAPPLVQPVQAAARMAGAARRAPEAPIDSVKLTVGGARQDLGATVTGTVASAAAGGEKPTAPDNPLDRLDAVVATLQSQVATQAETRRHVVDSAMAAQAAHRSRMMILEDASLAISAQGQATPGTVLSLLRAD